MEDLSTKSIGNLAEQKACAFLQKNGLQLLECNYYCRVGEIDLIMRDNEDIVFIEVRTRNQSGYGDALESVTPFKQQKILKTATHYLLKKKWYDKVNCRFDVIGVYQNHFDWIKNAFSEEIL